MDVCKYILSKLIGITLIDNENAKKMKNVSMSQHDVVLVQVLVRVKMCEV